MAECFFKFTIDKAGFPCAVSNGKKEQMETGKGEERKQG